ncbi:sulfur carrier protein ThiS [Paenibacillus spongiae]|uniref:Sulfur carrier protein ThiS n=1 Tax=Paenibacillus spongiae TaxID=2909671 RepID=A0ABY5SJD1_9BACL|nr:sulfur carrier protein ThiS [Paenibacillus spongiae]
MNGRTEQTAASNVIELIQQLGLEGKRIVVELNGSILARDEWSRAEIENDAELELVHFVGGG